MSEPTRRDNTNAEGELNPEALEQLRAAGNQVPPEVATRLHEMRRAAVKQADQADQADQAGRGWWGNWRVAGSAVAAAASLVIVVALTWNQADSVPEMPVADERELAAARNIELLEQLEFMAWLEEEGSGAG